MILTPQKVPGKSQMPTRYKPSPQEGRYIQYRLRLAGEKFVTISLRLHLHKSTVDKVVYGQRRSRRIEAEIARILGKADWNDVVLEARSEVQKKPVEAILNEMRKAHEKKAKSQKGAFVNHMEDGVERATKIILEGLAAKEQREQARKLARAARRRALA